MLRFVAATAMVCAVSVPLAGCTTLEKYIGGATVATLAGAQSPSHEIKQIYYVGSFDPQGQVPPELYRIRVHGQASFISRVNFASGWVKAELIDSLGTAVSFDKEGGLSLTNKKDQFGEANLQTGRRLMQFGPEGFREAPKDHRLVIVMGTSPEDYFNAMNEALGQVKRQVSNQATGNLKSKLLTELVRVEAERRQLEKLEAQAEKGKKDTEVKEGEQ